MTMAKYHNGGRNHRYLLQTSIVLASKITWWTQKIDKLNGLYYKIFIIVIYNPNAMDSAMKLRSLTTIIVKG